LGKQSVLFFKKHWKKIKQIDSRLMADSSIKSLLLSFIQALRKEIENFNYGIWRTAKYPFENWILDSDMQKADADYVMNFTLQKLSVRNS